MKRLIVLLAVLFLTGGIAWAQMPNPTGLRWDANSEADLAGYYIYEATVSNGQVVGQLHISVAAPATAYMFVDGTHTDGQYYWKITAYDTAGNESGFSNEVTADFNVTPPAPPTGCAVVY